MTEIVFYWQGVIHALLLLLVANGTPVIAWKLLGRRFAWPVDAGIILSDGRPLFGRSKTWRGILSSIGLVSAVSWSMSYGLAIGVAFGGLAMIGDLSASYIKRRQGMVESSRARGLDTIPESLLPAVLLKSQLGLNGLEISVVVLLFFMIEEFVSPILYRLNIRKRPY
ncbi:MAG: CDP-archaeol synthase [Gammaproteobacteria bacterium HGW-Gammaproteobacteria-10]|nr:MAG: CDP-archaeol synthase [Gammaproteobacteria bacterium HGW-Gammaproteobacteria-10]